MRNQSPLRAALRYLVFTLGFASCVYGHDEPTSFIDLRLSSSGMSVSATASVTDLGHELPGVDPSMLLDSRTLAARRSEISSLVMDRMQLVGDGIPLVLQLQGIVPVTDKRDVMLEFRCEWKTAPEKLHVAALLFPYDPRHRTFINVYTGSDLLRQGILTAANPTLEFPTIRQQSLATVFAEFTRQGIHHIVIGPDHILFVVGLLLLGGGLRQLLKIVTAFTVAHSITLALATFRLITPPASIVEPVIALSIVFIGLHAFFNRSGRDPRMVFAFCFGLIHGFGFANVLQEMVLPRQALGVSLFAFNFGVEIAQASIVLAVAPLLALLRHRSVRWSKSVVATGALSITAVGAFWFFQRVIG